jgi:hypothetical protein
MGMGRTWGRLYAGTRHHRKLRILRQRCPESWWIFYPLLELAFETDDNGLIYVVTEEPFTLPELATEVGLTSTETLQSTLQLMANLQLISLENGFIRFLSYSDRQFESDDSKERVRNYRERIKKEPKVASPGFQGNGEETLPECHGNNHVTLQDRYGNGIVTPPEQNRTETEQNRKKSTRAEPAFETIPETPGPEKPLPSDDGLPAKPPGGGKGARSRCYYRLQEFEKFYQAYPRKAARRRAGDRWRTKVKQGRLPPFDTLIMALQAHKKSRQWLEGVIPHPATWLSEERWNDQLETEVDPWNAIH